MAQEALRGRLVERQTGRLGATHLLNPEVTTLGRGQANDIVVVSQFVSQRHAEVRWDGARYVLIDLSKNGTFVNGTRVTAPRPLQHGDVIVLPGHPSLALVLELSETTATWAPEAIIADAGAATPLRVDTDRAEVWVRNERVHLRPKEYRALVLLAEKDGTLVTKEALAVHVWPEHGGGVSDDDIAQLISGLRRKLEADPEHPRHLLTVRRLGYRLVIS